MSSPTLKAAILIFSTTAPSTDSSAGILSDVFKKEEGAKWDVIETTIVSDDVLSIQRSIMGWTDRENVINLVITTGGTGFALQDHTPEVNITSLAKSRREF
jgi:gephyrin